ncbi:MAG: hypothetical protein HQM10_25095 [Candidatus Riflebacteria bacterium]|nr:hypothetical protein [Candidatus Riflebacteria bacterium]
MKKAVTFVEVIISMAIVAIIVFPFLDLMYSSKKNATGSMCELLATHYSHEITDQLVMLGTSIGYKTLCSQSSLSMKDLLESLNDKLLEKEKMARLPLKNLDVSILVSPMARFFEERKITVEEIPGNRQLVKGDYFKVVVKIGWKLPSVQLDSNTSYHEEVVFLRKTL